MRSMIAALALACVLSISGFTYAADAKTGSTAPKKGVFEKVDKAADGKNSIYYKGGAKGTGQEWYLPVDEKVAVTIDGKDGALTELKAGQVLTFTVAKGTITKVAAETPKTADQK